MSWHEEDIRMVAIPCPRISGSVIICTEPLHSLEKWTCRFFWIQRVMTKSNVHFYILINQIFTLIIAKRCQGPAYVISRMPFLFRRTDSDLIDQEFVALHGSISNRHFHV